MSQLTKKAIVEATLNLAQSRSLNKITVRDIVEACGITRNTFYYHFHDIYEVLEDVIDAKFEALEGSWGSDPKAAAYELRDFCVAHKKILSNLYKTIGHDAMEGYLYRRLHAILMELLRGENVHYGVRAEDLELIANFYARGLTGELLCRLKTEDSDLISDTERWERLFDGTLRFCLENAKKLS